MMTEKHITNISTIGNFKR